MILGRSLVSSKGEKKTFTNAGKHSCTRKEIHEEYLQTVFYFFFFLTFIHF